MNVSENDGNMPVGGLDRKMSFYRERGADVCVGLP